MTKKTQKKLRKALLLISCAALLVCITVGVTVAYLTDTAEVKNTFTVGNVQITLDEANTDNDQYEVDGKTVTPERDAQNDYTSIKPGDKLAKDPTVTVLKDSEDCYVRAIVTLTKGNAIYELPSSFKIEECFDIGTNWEYKSEKYDSAKGTYTYEFWYKGIVAKNTADNTLQPLFTTVTVPSALTNEELATLNGMEINVEAHAIQADGFNGDVAAAWAAFKAE